MKGEKQGHGETQLRARSHIHSMTPLHAVRVIAERIHQKLCWISHI